MSKNIALVTVLAAALVSGGGCTPPPPRTMGVEITSDQGLWRLDGVQAARLEMDGWQVCVTETEISDLDVVPYLTRFVLAIVNTSPTQKLYVQPREIFIVDLDRRALWLGPSEPMVIEPGRRITLTYDKGSRPLALLYPFTIEVTVFRGPNAAEPRKAVNGAVFEELPNGNGAVASLRERLAHAEKFTDPFIRHVLEPFLDKIEQRRSPE